MYLVFISSFRFQIILNQSSHNNYCKTSLSCKFVYCCWSRIQLLTVGKIIELEVLHGVDHHDLIHLVDDPSLVENTLWGPFPSNLVFQISHVNCVQEILRLEENRYIYINILLKFFFFSFIILTFLMTKISFSGNSRNSSSEMLYKVIP